MPRKRRLSCGAAAAAASSDNSGGDKSNLSFSVAMATSATSALKESGNLVQQQQPKTPLKGAKRLSLAMDSRRRKSIASIVGSKYLSVLNNTAVAKDANVASPCPLCWQSPVTDKAILDWLDLRQDPATSTAAHYKCMLFASALDQAADPDDEDDQPPDSLAGFELDSLAREVKRGQKLRCGHCRRGGATAGCQMPRCPRSYHLPCAKTVGALLIHADNFALHCPAHWPSELLNAFAERRDLLRRQRLQELADSAGAAASTEPAELACPVCLDVLQLDQADAHRDIVFGPCCRNCFCHRTCAQAYADSAGSHYIKCPLCANSEQFRQAWINQGIEVPCRDASWELDADAFAAHRYRPRLCSHPACPDPEVDHYGEWLLKICYVCGADARHVTCAGMKTGRHRYCCQTCAAVVADSSSAGASGSRLSTAASSSRPTRRRRRTLANRPDDVGEEPEAEAADALADVLEAVEASG